MAKTREELVQLQLGAMAFQIACLMADLDAAREENATLKAKQADNTAETGPKLAVSH